MTDRDGRKSGRTSEARGARGRRGRGADIARGPGPGALVSTRQRPCQPWRGAPKGGGGVCSQP